MRSPDEATVKFLSSQVCEIFVDDDAVFDYYDIEESSENTSKVSSVFVRQGNDLTYWSMVSYCITE